jgi:hypothetical protein
MTGDDARFNAHVENLYSPDFFIKDYEYLVRRFGLNAVNNLQHGEELINLLNSNIYQLIINSYRELTGLNNHKNINRLSIVNIKDINFSDKEQDFINNLSSIKS